MARAIFAVTFAEDDPRTFEHWGRMAGASRSTLGAWCRAAGTKPRQSLEFARLLRGVLLTEGHIDQLCHVLDVSEPRTLQRLYLRAGLKPLTEPMSALEFLRTQNLITENRLLSVLEGMLAQRGPGPDRTDAGRLVGRHGEHD